MQILRAFGEWRIWVTLLFLLAGVSANAQEAGERVIKTGTIEEDLYLAGGEVRVLAQVAGDVVVAGGEVVVGETVGGDVAAAGGSVEVRAAVQDDVRAAGGRVTLGGQIAGDAVAAGGRVRLEPDAQVGERAWLAGADVEVAGRVGLGLKAAGGRVVIGGEVRGDVALMAQRIEVLPTARIGGDLVYASPQEALIDPGAQIAGEVKYRPLEEPTELVEAVAAGVVVLLLLALLVAGGVYVGLFPRFSHAAAGSIRSHPWKSLGLGLALLFATPPVAFLLLVTVVGSLLGLVLLAVYFVSLLAALLTGLVYLGDTVLRWMGKADAIPRGRRIFAMAVALPVVALLQLIPVIGQLATFVLVLLAFGALALELHRRYLASETNASSAAVG